jgi:hypothetical protein
MKGKICFISLLMSMVGISAFSSISTGMVGFAAERVTTTFLVLHDGLKWEKETQL